jgi:hypothetical protein
MSEFRGKSDPALLDAFRKQCAHMDPGLVFLAWQGQADVDPDDLIDIVKEVAASAAAAKEEETGDE